MKIDWKRRVAYPFAQIVNCFNRLSKTGGVILRLPDWRHNYPSWTQDIISNTVIRTPYGFEILCDVLDYIGHHIIVEKTWEPFIGKTIQACVTPGSICFDVGANIGFHTLIMSLSAGCDGRVIAFEPDFHNLEYLLGNLRRNNISNTCVLSLALSEHGDISRMAAPSQINYGNANFRGGEADRHGQPAMLTRADILPLLKKGETISLVKIDVEGLEFSVLQGLNLERIQYLICEMNPEWNDTNSIHMLMQKAGFKYLVALPDTSERPFPKGQWLKPEIYSIPGQHDALFYRDLSDKLINLIKPD